jgi:cytochrome c-type biogenesis protein
VVLAWYAWLSGLTQGAVLSLQNVADAVALPVVSAILFGLIGAMSPCQLTTGIGALAYATARPAEARPVVLALAYVAGKTTVYLLLGVVVVVAGFGLREASIPVIVVARRALGPLMIVVGLGLAGAWRFRAAVGQGMAGRMMGRLRLRGAAGAFALGVVFSLAFCPTLFWLFFGLTVPLALRSTGGWAFPGLFALGSSLPLLFAASAGAAGAGAADRILGGLRRWQGPVQVGAGLTLVLAGLHDTVVYWAL